MSWHLYTRSTSCFVPRASMKPFSRHFYSSLLYSCWRCSMPSASWPLTQPGPVNTGTRQRSRPALKCLPVESDRGNEGERTEMSEKIGHRDTLYLFACHLEWLTKRNLAAYDELLA